MYSFKIEPKYDAAEDFAEGLAAVAIAKDGFFLNWGYIDKEGNEVIPFEYKQVRNFSEGLGAVAIVKRENLLYGYIDKSGNPVITFQYDYASDFHNGVALVLSREENFFGFIDLTGKLVINLLDLEIGLAYDFSENLAIVGNPSKLSNLLHFDVNAYYGYYRNTQDYIVPITPPTFILGYLDKQGNKIINLESNVVFALPFSEGLSAIVANVAKGSSKDYKYGFVSTSGELKIFLKYDEAESFSENLALVARNIVTDEGTYPIYGFINQDGVEIIPIKYGRASSFSDGLAWVFDATFNGFINSKGEPVINIWNLEVNVEEIYKFSEGLAVIGVKGEEYPLKYGYINKRGNIVIEPQYNIAQIFSEGLAAVFNGEQWGYIAKPSSDVRSFSKSLPKTLRQSPFGRENQLLTLQDYQKLSRQSAAWSRRGL